MTGTYRTKQAKSRSRFYILLSVILVIVLSKWGLPLFINLIAGSGSERSTTEEDLIPPQTPILSALPEATNSADISVEGYTEAGAQVKVLVNDQVLNIDTAKEDGSFSLPARLTTGSNRIQVWAIDSANNDSQSEIELVVYDSKPIELIVKSPKDGTEFFGKNSQVIEISGSTNKTDSQVVINNSFVLADNEGDFVHRFQLADGENTIKIVVSDKAGNVAEEEITIVYIP